MKISEVHIYDCFPLFNELDLLEIRLNTLNNIVDKFIIVEADKTFSGKPKPLYFQKHKARYKKFLKKIIYIPLTKYPKLCNSWMLEHNQRNKILLGLKNCQPEDIICISDLDEIPNPGALEFYRDNKKTGVYKLRQNMYYYFVNYRNFSEKYWCNALVLRYQDILDDCTKYYHYKYTSAFDRTINEGCTPTKLRLTNFPILEYFGGWHFSFLGGLMAIKLKVQSYSHQEYNNKYFLNDKHILSSIKKGKDLFGRPYLFVAEKLNTTDFPDYIVQNKSKYKNLICPVHYGKKNYRDNLLTKLIYILRWCVFRIKNKLIRILQHS